MGITARGPGSRETALPRDGHRYRATPFTVAGRRHVGRRVRQRRLRERTTAGKGVDHRDIFIDPNPDPERSFTERRARSILALSWQDYNKDHFARWWVYSRRRRKNHLSEEARAARLEGENSPRSRS
jgi:glutamate dehydrogenase